MLIHPLKMHALFLSLGWASTHSAFALIRGTPSLWEHPAWDTGWAECALQPPWWPCTAIPSRASHWGQRTQGRPCAKLALGARPKANGVMWTVTGQICLREKGEPKSTHKLSLNSCGQEDPVTLASLNLFTFQLWPRINSCLGPALSRRDTRKKGAKGILMEMWPRRRNPRNWSACRGW